MNIEICTYKKFAAISSLNMCLLYLVTLARVKQMSSTALPDISFRDSESVVHYHNSTPALFSISL